jgi:hypothetical protein
MKRYSLQSAGVLVAALVAFGSWAPVHAGPSTSPSARQAARLKHRPPAGWIRHYLPDDRYKILGGTWKFVSTELDRFYYPAWAPEMLRQSPNRVIGFNSAEDAQEAGYMAGGAYSGVNPGFDRSLATQEVESVTVSGVTFRNGRGQRVTLADGVSTVIVPSGWMHGRTTQAIPGLGPLKADILVPVSQRRGKTQSVFVMSTAIPGLPQSLDLGQIIQADALNQGSQRIGAWGGINNQVSNAQKAMQTISIRPATLGGIRGILATPRTTQARRELGFDGPTLIAGRGSKLYIMASTVPRNAAGYTTILNTLQLR